MDTHMDAQSIPDQGDERPVDALSPDGPVSSPAPKPEAKSDLTPPGDSAGGDTVMINMKNDNSDALVEPSEGQAVVLSFHDSSDEEIPPPMVTSPIDDLKRSLSNWDHVIYDKPDWLAPPRDRRTWALSPVLEEAFDWAQDHRERPLIFHAEEVAHMTRDDLELQLMDLQGFTLCREAVMDDMQSELQEKDGDRSQMLDQIEALEDQVTQARRKQIKLIEQAMNAQKEFGESLADMKNSKTSPQTRPLSAHGRYYRAADRDSHVGFISGYRSPREECRKILIETKGGQKVLKTYSDNAVQTKTVMEDFLANPEYEATLKRLKLSEQENKFLHDQLDEEKKKYQDLTQNKKMVAAMFERDILERDQRYADMQRKVKDKDRKFAMIAKEIQEREEVYIQHQEKYNDREQKFRSMQIELCEKDLVHGRLLQKVEEQEKMISDLQMKYQNAEKTSADLKQQLGASEKRHRGLHEKYSNEVKHLKAQLENVPSACNHCNWKKSPQAPSGTKAKSEVLLAKRKSAHVKKTPIVQLIESYDLKNRNKVIERSSGAYRADLVGDKVKSTSLQELRHQSNKIYNKPKCGKSEILANGRDHADKKLPQIRVSDQGVPRGLPKIAVARPPLPPQPPTVPRHPDNRRRRIVKVKASAAF